MARKGCVGPACTMRGASVCCRCSKLGCRTCRLGSGTMGIPITSRPTAGAAYLRQPRSRKIVHNLQQPMGWDQKWARPTCSAHLPLQPRWATAGAAAAAIAVHTMEGASLLRHPAGCMPPTCSRILLGTSPAAPDTPPPPPAGCTRSGEQGWGWVGGTTVPTTRPACGAKENCKWQTFKPKPCACSRQTPRPPAPERRLPASPTLNSAAGPASHLSGSACARPTAASTRSMRSAAAAAASASSFSRSCSLPRITAVSFSCLHNQQRSEVSLGGR